MIAFINSNSRPTFVDGSVVYEVNVTGETAQNMVALYNEYTGQISSPEAAAVAHTITALLRCDVSIANRRELEYRDDSRMKILNRRPEKKILKRLSR